MQPADFLNSESPHVTSRVNMECVFLRFEDRFCCRHQGLM